MRRSVGAGIARPVAGHGGHECLKRATTTTAAASSADMLIWGERQRRGRRSHKRRRYSLTGRARRRGPQVLAAGVSSGKAPRC